MASGGFFGWMFFEVVSKRLNFVNTWIRNLPLSQFCQPRIVEAGVAADAAPTSLALFELVLNEGMDIHNAILAKLCYKNKQHFANQKFDNLGMKKSSKLILAENLRKLMDSHPLLGTQQSLAKKSGVAQTTIGNMLKADFPSWPKLDSIEMVAEAFGMTADELISESMEDPQASKFGREMNRLYAEVEGNPVMLTHFLNTIEAIRGMVSTGGVSTSVAVAESTATPPDQTKASLPLR